MSEQEILKEFIEHMVDNQKECPPEFRELINEHFWELVD